MGGAALLGSTLPLRLPAFRLCLHRKPRSAKFFPSYVHIWCIHSGTMQKTHQCLCPFATQAKPSGSCPCVTVGYNHKLPVDSTATYIRHRDMGQPVYRCCPTNVPHVYVAREGCLIRMYHATSTRAGAAGGRDGSCFHVPCLHACHVGGSGMTTTAPPPICTPQPRHETTMAAKRSNCLWLALSVQQAR